ncbi:MAG: DUF4154 domain-containing protein [Candidatus Aminicenantes bacterium]|nr:DUF4154 domain-containing protein [Candidatus Aminicenantes bacterium]NIM77292.1 DUF4154 domain-containing protein [Candidatus Aminicenantes bacterium]NIN16593.1 DUF4154 domain-containing protein [Candidatus Aminicenantes bacterium]NIN40451.1 DUF4154 domain-containing protein [Candidatus Aminicenantes bacterium]NIN83271.1 DUF4154 domain-containing protein [Candidatus Aminicenantes bacterium]
MMKKHLVSMLVSVILCLVLPFSLFSIEDEYYRKAALFRVFSQHIEWPKNSGLDDRSKPFVIGIIGKNPFGDILEKAYSQTDIKIKDKNVEIRYISKMQEIEGCHILFITKSVGKELVKIITITRKKPILTIGEKKGFAQKGVLFNLYISKGQIRFEINALTLRESGLIVDSQLLSVAKIVNMPGAKK